MRLRVCEPRAAPVAIFLEIQPLIDQPICIYPINARCDQIPDRLTDEICFLMLRRNRLVNPP